MSFFQVINLLVLVINLSEKIKRNLGETAFYVNDHLPSQTIKNETPSDIEILTTGETDFTTSPETITSKLSKKYEKLIVMRDFTITTVI